MFSIGIIIFPDVEELDFIGPFETLSYINKLHPNSCTISLLAPNKNIIKAFNGLRIIPDDTFNTKKEFDILIVPGGHGRKKAMFDNNIITFITEHAKNLKYLCSICTGSFILAETGLMDGLKATTHFTAFDEMKQRYPNIETIKQRVVKNDRIWLAAGISSGIDLALELIATLYSEEDKKTIAERLEYIPRT